VLVAPMPGIMAEHVQLVVADGQLRIRAERDVDGDHDYLLHEWPAAALERTVELPDEAGWPITAAVAHGQLTVTLARHGTRPEGESITIVPPAEHGPTGDAVSDVIDLRPPGAER
jgi:HSP20 family molecular chaperone IbpA